MLCHISHLSNILVRLTLNKSKYPRTIHMSSHICHLRTGPCCGIAKTGVEAWQSVSAQCPGNEPVLLLGLVNLSAFSPTVSFPLFFTVMSQYYY